MLVVAFYPFLNLPYTGIQGKEEDQTLCMLLNLIMQTNYMKSLMKMLRKQGIKVETGQFGAMMDVQFTNVGPVTLIIDSKDK